jgi:dGTP triphosphohydrolase
MKLEDKIDKYIKIDEGKNKYEKYFGKDLFHFFETFDKYRTILNKSFYDETLLAFNQLVKYAKRMDIEEVPAHLFGNHINLLISVLSNLQKELGAFKNLKIIKFDASLKVQVDAWLKDIKKDYKNYVAKM